LSEGLMDKFLALKDFKKQADILKEKLDVDKNLTEIKENEVKASDNMVTVNKFATDANIPNQLDLAAQYILQKVKLEKAIKDMEEEIEDKEEELDEIRKEINEYKDEISIIAVGRYFSVLFLQNRISISVIGIFVHKHLFSCRVCIQKPRYILIQVIFISRAYSAPIQDLRYRVVNIVFIFCGNLSSICYRSYSSEHVICILHRCSTYVNKPGYKPIFIIIILQHFPPVGCLTFQSPCQGIGISMYSGTAY